MRKNLIVFSLLGTSVVTPNLINYQLSNRENVKQMKVYRDMKKHYVNTKFYAEHTGYEYIPIYNFHYVNNFIKSYSALRNTMIKCTIAQTYVSFKRFLKVCLENWMVYLLLFNDFFESYKSNNIHLNIFVIHQLDKLQ